MKPASKQLLLTLFSVLLIAVFYSTGTAGQWFRKRIILYYREFAKQSTDHKDDVAKKMDRYGNPYKVSQLVRNFMVKNQLTDATVLIEPREYLLKEAKFQMPEPAVFYYFSNGIKAVQTNSPNVAEARFLLRIKERDAEMVQIQSYQELQEILKSYSAYKN